MRNKYKKGSKEYEAADKVITHIERNFGKTHFKYLKEKNPYTCCLKDHEREAFLDCAVTKLINEEGAIDKKKIKKYIKDAMRETAQTFDGKRKADLKHNEYDGHLLGRTITRVSFARIMNEYNSAPVEENLYAVDEILKEDNVKKQINILKGMQLCKKNRVMWVWFDFYNKNDPYAQFKRRGKELLRCLGLEEPISNDEKQKRITWYMMSPLK